MLKRRKLLIATFMVFLLSIFIAANVSAQCEGTMEGDMCWKDYNDVEPGGYMPDIDQNQDFANVLAIDEHFSGGPGLPPSLSSYLWNLGGTCTVGGGLLTVDACAAYNVTYYNPGHTLEFDATFTAYAYQHVGFCASGATPIFNDIPWILFSTGSTGTQLYARICPLGDPLHPCTTNSGDDAIALGAAYLGSKHRYRIDWGVNSIEFYIDGSLVASRNYTITPSAPGMRAGISDYTLGGGNLTADWISMDLQREYCAPVAEANSLWWLDKAHGIGIFELPYDGLGYIGGDINGDGVADILDLVQDLAIRMNTNVNHTGTTVLDEQDGIDSFITDYGLSDELYEHTIYPTQYPDWQSFFSYIETEVERSQDVKLDLGFWHVDYVEGGPGNWMVTWSRRGGHAVTVAGVDSVNLLFAISDPDNDAAEAGGLGVVRPGPHGYPHDPIIHNNEMYASHDIYTVGPSPSPGGNMGLLNYPWKWNFPEDEWETAGPLPSNWPEPLEYSMTFTEIEAAVIVSPITAVCGNGILEPGEECDDGNNIDGDGCSAICVIEFCGDNIVQPQLGEQCDDGNNVSGDGCNAICIIEFCGDNIVQPQLGEQCDDGNNVSGDGCNANCIIEFCGDNIVQPQLGEQCDDGNNVSGDGCDANCIIEFCGDNIVQPQLGETCDPQGGSWPPNGNPCRQSCTYCGDDLVNNGEACDDGNSVNGDGCENDCSFTPVCGNQVIEPGETCDPPGQPGPNQQQPGICYQSCLYCGDGLVNNGEACDDGNGVNGDGCENNCTVTPGVQVTYPNGGETIPACTPVTITWTAPPAAVKFDVGYSVAGGPWNLIASGVTGHSYNWTPQVQGNQTNVRVAVRGRDAGNAVVGTDTSNAPFTVLVVRVTYPSNPGIVWTSGQQQIITWQSNCTPAFVDIYRSIDGGGTWTFLTRVYDNPGAYILTVPTIGTTIHNARIGVRLLDQYLNNMGQDAGDNNFTVQPAP